MKEDFGIVFEHLVKNNQLQLRDLQVDPFLITINEIRAASLNSYPILEKLLERIYLKGEFLRTYVHNNEVHQIRVG